MLCIITIFVFSNEELVGLELKLEDIRVNWACTAAADITLFLKKKENYIFHNYYTNLHVTYKLHSLGFDVSRYLFLM